MGETTRNNFKSSITSSMRDSSSRSETETALAVRPTSSTTTRKNVLGDSLSVNKLHFDRVEIVGREEHASMLKERLESCVFNRKTEVVMISGVSGCGKSSLATTLKKQIERQTSGDGIFVQGKFDQKAAEEPYSAVIEACHELASRILVTESTIHKMRDTLESRLIGMEKKLLISVLPILHNLFNINSTAAEPSKHHNDKENAAEDVATSGTQRQDLITARKELLESAFRKYIRAVTSYYSPLCIVLDDLQWSDPGTLRLLQDMVIDGSTPNLLLVGCYRSDEVGDRHILHQMLQSLGEKEETNPLAIELGNLTVDQCSKLLSTLLSMDEADKTRQLAELCHQRTMGNPFFFLAFCKLLQLEELLTFELGTFSWSWDLEEIQIRTGATDNVVNLMALQMSKASPEVLHLIKLAACLPVGSALSAHTLFLIWTSLPLEQAIGSGDDPGSSRDILFKETLEGAVRQGFLERSGKRLRWIHDKVQEAAMGLDTTEEFAARQHQVGKTLLSSLSPTELDDELFGVVNLLNCGTSTSIELAELNLQAATKANAIGAFGIQTTFAQEGVRNLPHDCWKRNKDTALELFSLYAQAASSQGNFEKMNELCDVVLQQDECSTVDKAICAQVAIQSIGRRGNLSEAISQGIDLAGKLGCKIPANKAIRVVAGVSGLLRHRSFLKRNTPTVEMLDSMPLMTDPVQKQIMRVLANVIVYAYLKSDIMVQILAGRQMCDRTLKYGLADQSQSSFAGTAVMMMHGLGEWELAVKITKFARAMHKRLETAGQECTQQSAVIGMSHSMILPWLEPMKSQLKHLIEGYKKGMEVGDTEWAFANIVWYLELSLYSGNTLKSVEADIQIYLPQFEALRANVEYATMVRSFWQACLNLMGQSENTTVVSGKALNEDDFQSSPKVPERLVVMKSFLCVIFGDHELGAKLALERGGRYIQERAGQPVVMLDPFVRAMSLYAMARKTGASKYKREAARARKTIKDWVKHGNPNSHHHLELLNAERSALSRKNNTCDLYSRAARTAVRGGYIHDAALANERHAEYLMEAPKVDRDDVAHRLKEAIRRYTEWGATRKVEILEQAHKEFL